MGSGSVDLFEVFKVGFESGNQEDQYLAYLAYDACLSYVHPTHIPLERPFPDGDSMRRAQAIRSIMKHRCEGFWSVRTEDLNRMGKDLVERTRSGDSMAGNYASMPRSPSNEDVIQARERLSQLLLRHGPAALLANSGNLVDWLVEVQLSRPDIQVHELLKHTETLSAAALIAMCHAGFDCSAESTLYGITCGAHQDCGPNFEESILASLGEKRATALAQAKVIGQAFIHRNPAPLGLISQ